MWNYTAISNRGFSLLETLIVLTISSIVLFAVLGIFSQHKSRGFFQNKILNEVENMQLLEHILQKNIQNAGEAGCQKGVNLILKSHIEPNRYDIRLLEGYAIYAEKNSLWIEKASYARSHLQHPMQTPEDILTLENAKPFAEGDIVLIADCTHGDLFAITHVNGNQISHAVALQRLYGVDAAIMHWQIDEYYIAAGYNQSPALFQRTILPKAHTLELVSDIQTFTPTFGILKGTSALFLPAEDITHWQDVRGVLLDTMYVNLYNKG